MRRITIEDIILICFLVFAVLSPASAQDEQHIQTTKLMLYDIEELMDLEFVTATRTEVKLKEVPATAYVITDGMIRERGYRTLSDALHDVPGIDFQHTYGIWPELFYQRGLPQRMLLYVDGISGDNISERAINRGGSIRFPLDNVKRIEIVAGPASAIFGANAFTGVINIITKDGKSNPGREVRGTAGAFLDKGSLNRDYMGESGSFAARGKFGSLEDAGQYSISGYYLKSQGPDFRGIKNLDSSNTGYFWSDYYNNSHDETYNVTARFSFGDLSFELISWQYLQGQGTFANGHYQIDTDRQGFKGSSWDFADNSIKIAHFLDSGPSIKLESDIILRHMDLLSSSHEQYPNTHTPDAYNFPNDVTTQSNYARPDYSYELDERLEWKINKQFQALMGAEATYTVVPLGYGSFERHSFNNYGVYAQGIYRPGERLALTGGYRFDYNTDYKSSYSPRLSVVFTEGDLVLKVLYSEAFRAPSPWELFNATLQRKANPDLVPETLKSYETGLGYTLFRRHYISLTAYYTEVSNIILEVNTNQFNPNAGKSWNQNQNVGKAETRGLEASADFKVSDNLGLYLNYTYSEGRYKDLPPTLIVSPTVANGDAIPNIAPHKINTGITYSPLPKLALHLRANYVSKRETVSTNPVKSVDGYTLLHTNILWDDAFAKGASISLLCRNLLDEKVFDPGIRTAEGTYYPTKHPIEGRNVWLTLGYRF